MHDFFSNISRLKPGYVYEFSGVKNYFNSLHYPLSFYISKKVASANKVGVIYPKSLLKAVLPLLKDEHGDKFVIMGSSLEGFKTVMSVADCDVVLGEPVGFSNHGLFVNHAEARLWGPSTLACVAIAQHSNYVPSDCDLVYTEKIICEKGLVNSEHLAHVRDL
ncbi:hypothetical protein KY329_02195 [Candidatus Woesearchaeota archaeon]|nr:hypothetical protein [Candidatus Woesearchaeota archaeon]